MTLNKYILTILFGLIFSTTTLAQSPGTVWSSNVTLLCKTTFGKSGTDIGRDVWGWKDNQTGKHYALVILNKGLSIVDASTPSAPVEVVHINHSNTNSNLSAVDVETFESGGQTYAYLARALKQAADKPSVLIINLRNAITLGGTIFINPEGSFTSVFVGKLDNKFQDAQAHTLTITDGYLYIATLLDKITVWNLNANPTNPTYKGALTITPSNSQVHEMFVSKTGSSTSRIYAACIRGGLQVIDLNLSNMSFTQTGQNYDNDKAYPNQVYSSDPNYDYRETHSAWPTSDGQYIFTTDELALAPISNVINHVNDANLYSTGTLNDAQRQGAYLRTWKTSLLGTTSALKGGYYAVEESQQGITNISQIVTSTTPNGIHQMYAKGNCMYVAHYTQGFRVLDISNPESIVELGYYDDFPTANMTIGDSLFFRANANNWYQGIYGVYPDPNRPGIVYAGSLSDGFYIFDVLPIATPSGFALSGSVGQNPTLTWNQSTDTGLEGYKLYQSIDGSPYSLLVTLNKNTTSFVDNGVIIGNDKDDPSVCYYITAFNIAGKESNNSIPRCTKAGGLNKSGSEYAESNVPYTNYLGTAYPNPFNPTTKISFGLASTAKVRIIVYNTLGQEIAVLADNVLGEGNHEVEFNAKGLPSGIYLYKMEASGISGEQFNIVEIKKMIVSK